MANPMVRDLYDDLKKSEKFHQTFDVEPKLNGQKISTDLSNIVVQADMANVWQQTTAVSAADAPKGVWFSLATFQIRMTVPLGYNAHNDSVTGSRVSLGKVHVKLSHDKDFVPTTTQDGKTLLIASVEHAGPKPTQSDANVSDTISQNVGANIGAFGEILQGGVSVSQDLSHTMSHNLKDCEVSSGMSGHGPDTVWWIYDYTQLPESPVAMGTFDQQLQAIWRYQPKTDVELTRMAWVLRIEWEPRVWWASKGHKFSEGFGDKLTATATIRYDNKDGNHDIAPPVLGRQEKPPPGC